MIDENRKSNFQNHLPVFDGSSKLCICSKRSVCFHPFICRRIHICSTKVFGPGFAVSNPRIQRIANVSIQHWVCRNFFFQWNNHSPSQMYYDISISAADWRGTWEKDNFVHQCSISFPYSAVVLHLLNHRFVDELSITTYKTINYSFSFRDPFDYQFYPPTIIAWT